MQRYKLSHVWNEDPNYEAMARSLLDLLLRLEAEGRLDELLGPTNHDTTSPADTEEAA